MTSFLATDIFKIHTAVILPSNSEISVENEIFDEHDKTSVETDITDPPSSKDINDTSVFSSNIYNETIPSTTSSTIDSTTTVSQEPQTSSTPPQMLRDNDDYLNDAVFIGDSITEGLKFYLGKLNTTILSAKSLNPDTIFTANVSCPNGEKLTILNGLKTVSFSKVYILVGTNGIAFMSTDHMANNISLFIDKIKEINPKCTIYLQSMTPVTREKEQKDSRFNTQIIAEYNNKLISIAQQKNIIYLNINSLFADSEGYIPTDHSPDGIHFYKEQYSLWYEFILNHTERVFDFNTNNPIAKQ